MQSIPTKFNGVMYRSRLEAKWACFFTILGWEFQYEPFDLSGWIPDFVLKGKKQNTLVEIKPFFDEKEFAPHLDKIFNALFKATSPLQEVLLLGASLDESEFDHDYTRLGWLFGAELQSENLPPSIKDYYYDTNEAAINAYRDSYGVYGFFDIYGSWVDRMTDEYDGDTMLAPGNHQTFLEVWDECTNRVQWQSHRNNDVDPLCPIGLDPRKLEQLIRNSQRRPNPSFGSIFSPK